MAFGGLRTTFKNSATSIGTSIAASGTQAVSLGDLIFVLGGEQTALTIASVADNLGNAYTSCDNSVNDAGTSTGRAFWARVKDNGTLTTVTITCNGGTNNGVIVVAIIEGPITNAIDKNPANITSDIASPFVCQTTGTLSQANEIVIGWLVGTGSTANTATSPNLLADQQATAAILHGTIGYQAVTVTTAVTPTFAAASNPTDQLMGVATFRRDDTPLGAGRKLGMHWLPNPIGAARPASFLSFINPGLDLTTTVPADTTNLPSVVSDWGPPPPAAPRSNALGTWINSSNLPLNDFVQAPFSETDWPNPRGFATRNGTWITPSRDLAPPFEQSDWPNPRRQAPRDWTWINPSRDLAPPFVPPSWSNPRGFATKDGTWINPGIRDVVASPFRQTDWSNPRAAQRSTDLTWLNGLPPIEFVTRVPLVTRYNAQSWHVALSSQPRANLLPLVTPVFAPFTPVNWTNPKGRQPQTGGHLNSALPRFEDTNTYLPSVALDWYTPPAKPQTLSFISPGGLPLNTVVVTLPFRQSDWPNPRAAQRSTDLTWLSSPHVLQRPNTKPFDQSSWPVPTPRAPQPLSYTLPGGLPLNTVVVAAPFAQYNWPNPRPAPRPADLSWLSSPHVLQRPNIQPFAKSDWTVPAGRTPLPQSFTISYSLPLNTPAGPKPFTQLDWPNPNGPAQPIVLRTLIGQSLILSIEPPVEPPTDFPPHEPPTDSGGAGIKSGVWKPGKRANYRSYRYITDKEIEQLTGTEIRQSARDLRADVRKDPFAEEVQKEILALSRVVNQLADIDRLEASVAELSRAIEYARKAREEADEDEEISFLLLS